MEQDLQAEEQFLPTKPRNLSTDAVIYPDTTPTTHKHIKTSLSLWPTQRYQPRCARDILLGDCTTYKPVNECI